MLKENAIEDCLIQSASHRMLYRKLKTKNRKKDIYIIARLRERKIGDLTQVKCIKNED